MVNRVLLTGAACLFTLGAAESTAHLSEAQRSQLEKITRGDVGKREVELVLAHFNENTSWSDPYASVRTIYCKGRRVPGCIPLENVGREGHTYLHHIISNYDNLADWTVFSQAGAPTAGYRGHRLGGGHMQPGLSFHEYLLRDEAKPQRDAFFVFTGALQLSSLFHAVRSSFLFPPTAPEELTTAQCPGAQTTADHWERLDIPQWFYRMMSQKCGIQVSHVQAYITKYWQEHVGSEMPENDMVFFTQGARFAVSRDRIRQRSREEYMDLLSLLSGSPDPCANYMNEWLWYYIMGKPQQAPCAVPDVDTKAPLSAAVRFLSGTSGDVSSGESTSDSSASSDDDAGSSDSSVSSDSSGSSATSGSSDSSGSVVDDTTTEKSIETSAALSSFGLGALATSVAALWAGVQ